MARDRILFLDAYDSFTNNIVSLLTTLLDVDVHILRIDSPLLDRGSPSFGADLRRELGCYSAVVCGPGPGSPERAGDVGLMSDVWRAGDDDDAAPPPTLGICLGFQSLVCAFGGRIRRLSRGLHGLVREIDHCGVGVDATTAGDIFAGVGKFRATLYHSLCADVGQDEVPDSTWESRRWEAVSQGRLLPLAWAVEERPDAATGTERILMAARHCTLPFWGLQYHPESVCTDASGHAVLANWFRAAQAWNRRAGRAVSLSATTIAGPATRPSLLRQLDQARHSAAAAAWDAHLPAHLAPRRPRYAWRTTRLPPGVSVADLVSLLDDGDGGGSRDRIVLDSSDAQTSSQGALDVRGRHSVVAADVDRALRFEYVVGGDDAADVRTPDGLCSRRVPLPAPGGAAGLWQLLAGFLEDRRLVPTSDSASAVSSSPFVGGFMGYATYELGLDNIGVDVGRDDDDDDGRRRPDLCFVWVTRSVVVDHAAGLVRAQELCGPEGADDDGGGPAEPSWTDAVVAALEASRPWREHDEALAHKAAAAAAAVGANHNGPVVLVAAEEPLPHDDGDCLGKGRAAAVVTAAEICAPDPDEYEAKVELCQRYIAAGESYELCLTDQTRVLLTSRRPASSSSSSSLPASLDTSWALFTRLRSRQPVPFGSYVRLGGATLVSSSPERFLEHSATGLCSMRPMKGTVAKAGGGGAATAERARELLHVPKEMAENLMIVDLVCHDLHSVCGPGRVGVDALMKVEEYATVWQMVTVVNGMLPAEGEETEGEGEGEGEWEGRVGGQPRRSHRYTGLDALAASLPPGSMTGAPKKRSCELLQAIEGRGRPGGVQERGLYSGVVGYVDATGKGDWSVTIRSLFRWDDETREEEEVGGGRAGGAAGTRTEEVWHIGAGGAVTILSTPAGERDEMAAKLAGPLGLFAKYNAV